MNYVNDFDRMDAAIPLLAIGKAISPLALTKDGMEGSLTTLRSEPTSLAMFA